MSAGLAWQACQVCLPSSDLPVWPTMIRPSPNSSSEWAMLPSSAAILIRTMKPNALHSQSIAVSASL
jgi:hypothetical protein